MIEINLGRVLVEFRLKYTHRETGKEVRVKMVTRQDYVIYDPETKTREKITRSLLIRDYEAHPDNSRPTQKTKINFTRHLTKDAP
jgi:hypothetical protein